MENFATARIDVRESKLAWLKKNWTIIVGLFAIFVGFLLLLTIHTSALWQKLLIGFPIEVGFAFVIAWVVGLTVEREARRELSDHAMNHANTISENVFKYLYCVNLPREVFDVVETHIFKEKIIKKDQSISFRLCDPVDDSGWIVMEADFEYTLKNIGDAPVKHDIKFYASKVSGLDAPKDSSIGLRSLRIGDESIEKERFNEIDLAAPDEIGQQKYKYEKEIRAGEELRVRVSFSQQKRVVDNDLFQSNNVCLYSRFEVRFNPNKFDVFWEPVHAANDFPQYSEAPHSNECRRIGEIKTPLLPKNGVFMWWNTKPI